MSKTEMLDFLDSTVNSAEWNEMKENHAFKRECGKLGFAGLEKSGLITHGAKAKEQLPLSESERIAEEAFEMIDDGSSVKETAAHFNLPDWTLRRYCNMHGFVINKNRGKKPTFTAAQFDAVVALINDGYRMGESCRKVKVTTKSFRRALDRNQMRYNSKLGTLEAVK